MDRRIVSKEELLRIINTRLSKYDECKNCQFQNIAYKLAEPDVTGCNWRNAVFVCGGETSEFCRKVAERIVSEARKEMNII